jgi:predicted 3-demethylubiquinone-9 3-methyltransferase (glyoxalase superfamily)
MTVTFELDGRPFVALNGGPEYRFNEAVSFQVSCEDQEEVDRYWAALTADGGEEGPCGWCKDRWGLSWQIVPKALPQLLGDPDQARAQRAMSAMLQMGKLDIAALRAAADG